MKKILFSDIDGCIINELNTDFECVRSELNRLAQADFDIILSTAKTAHEVIALNQHINLPGPFIVENGTGILLNGFPCSVSSHKEVTKIESYSLLQLGGKKPDPLLLKSFCPPDSLLTQMNNIQLVKDLGVSLEATELAKIRFFTEPIYIKNLSLLQLKKLKKQLGEKKLYFIQTNNFLHACTSKNSSKGAAVNFILSNFYANQSYSTFAIGDSFNDFSMLNMCDHAYYILNQPLKHRVAHWRLIPEKGFLGWQTGLRHIVSHLLPSPGLPCAQKK